MLFPLAVAAVMFSASINCVFFCFISLLMALFAAAASESTEQRFFFSLGNNFQQLLFSVSPPECGLKSGAQKMALAYAI